MSMFQVEGKKSADVQKINMGTKKELDWGKQGTMKQDSGKFERGYN